eukprot:328408-Prymnesium_polylepis.1
MPPEQKRPRGMLARLTRAPPLRVTARGFQTAVLKCAVAWAALPSTEGLCLSMLAGGGEKGRGGEGRWRVGRRGDGERGGGSEAVGAKA